MAELLQQEKRCYAVESLMDTDFYKFTMGQLIFHRYEDVPVKFAFKNRTRGVKLGEVIDERELRKELNHARKLRFDKAELDYLRGLKNNGDRLFKDDYLEFLGELKLPAYELEVRDGDLKMEFPGKWSEATYWETISLSTVNELYYRNLMKGKTEEERERAYATGAQRLGEKIEILKKRPDITVTEFGTRRRFSRPWQEYVVVEMNERLPPEQFLGTSNTNLAMKYDITPRGTFAHEMDMAMYGIMNRDVGASHKKVLEDWWDEYGHGLSIALTDTYGTDFFYKNLTKEQAMKWKGDRQDSGDPIKFIRKKEKFYDSKGVDPRGSLTLFSDGLDMRTILRIADFPTRIRKTYGWGTNLTNDLGFMPLSLVVKLVESNGLGTVKLSDNIAKAIGRPKDIETVKRKVRYNVNEYNETIY